MATAFKAFFPAMHDSQEKNQNICCDVDEILWPDVIERHDK